MIYGSSPLFNPKLKGTTGATGISGPVGIIGVRGNLGNAGTTGNSGPSIFGMTLNSSLLFVSEFDDGSLKTSQTGIKGETGNYYLNADADVLSVGFNVVYGVSYFYDNGSGDLQNLIKLRGFTTDAPQFFRIETNNQNLLEINYSLFNVAYIDVLGGSTGQLVWNAPGDIQIGYTGTFYNTTEKTVNAQIGNYSERISIINAQRFDLTDSDSVYYWNIDYEKGNIFKLNSYDSTGKTVVSQILNIKSPENGLVSRGITIIIPSGVTSSTDFTTLYVTTNDLTQPPDIRNELEYGISWPLTIPPCITQNIDVLNLISIGGIWHADFSHLGITYKESPSDAVGNSSKIPTKIQITESLYTCANGNNVFGVCCPFECGLSAYETIEVLCNGRFYVGLTLASDCDNICNDVGVCCITYTTGEVGKVPDFITSCECEAFKDDEGILNTFWILKDDNITSVGDVSCLPEGPCCDGFGGCQEVLEENCSGYFLGTSLTCAQAQGDLLCGSPWTQPDCNDTSPCPVNPDPCLVATCVDGTCVYTRDSDISGCACSGDGDCGLGGLDPDCFDAVCIDGDCVIIGTGNPDCEERGACCKRDTVTSQCINNLTQELCNSQGGEWAGANTLCSEINCEPIPTDCLTINGQQFEIGEEYDGGIIVGVFNPGYNPGFISESITPNCLGNTAFGSPPVQLGWAYSDSNTILGTKAKKIFDYMNNGDERRAKLYKPRWFNSGYGFTLNCDQDLPPSGTPLGNNFQTHGCLDSYVLIVAKEPVIIQEDPTNITTSNITPDTVSKFTWSHGGTYFGLYVTDQGSIPLNNEPADSLFSSVEPGACAGDGEIYGEGGCVLYNPFENTPLERTVYLGNIYEHTNYNLSCYGGIQSGGTLVCNTPLRRSSIAQVPCRMKTTGKWYRNWGIFNTIRMVGAESEAYNNTLGLRQHFNFGTGFTTDYTNWSQSQQTSAEAIIAYNLEKLNSSQFPKTSSWYIPSIDELSFIAHEIAYNDLNGKILLAGGTPIGDDSVGATGWVWSSTGTFNEGITFEYYYEKQNASDSNPLTIINTTPKKPFSKAWAMWFGDPTNIQNVRIGKKDRLNKYEVRPVKMLKCDRKYYDVGDSTPGRNNPAKYFRWWKVATPLTKNQIINGPE